MKQKIRKAVIPVAGFGTRMLPATKSIPKELLTIVDRPILDYVVAEAYASGIEHIIMVTGRMKAAIEDHFDHAFELDTSLRRNGKDSIAELLARGVPKVGAMSFVRQQEAKGLGHAVWSARHIVGDEPFAVVLPDMLMVDADGRIVLPKELRARIGLADGLTEVAFVGLGDKFQLWAPERFEERRARAREKVRQHRQLLGAGRRPPVGTGDDGGGERE